MRKSISTAFFSMVSTLMVLGIVLMGDPANATRLLCVGLILAGIIGLKLSS